MGGNIDKNSQCLQNFIQKWHSYKSWQNKQNQYSKMFLEITFLEHQFCFCFAVTSTNVILWALRTFVNVCTQKTSEFFELFSNCFWGYCSPELIWARAQIHHVPYNHCSFWPPPLLGIISISLSNCNSLTSPPLDAFPTRLLVSLRLATQLHPYSLPPPGLSHSQMSLSLSVVAAECHHYLRQHDYGFGWRLEMDLQQQRRVHVELPTECFSAASALVWFHMS